MARADGTIRLATPNARRWMSDYFDVSGRTTRVPPALQRWLSRRHPRAHGNGAAPEEGPVFTTDRDGRRLTVRSVADATLVILLFERAHVPVEVESLAALGLTARQAEVLAWVTEGKSNPCIGTILGLSPRTVQHHLNRIYQKLGVETRTAAAARVLRSARGTSP